MCCITFMLSDCPAVNVKLKFMIVTVIGKFDNLIF